MAGIKTLYLSVIILLVGILLVVLVEIPVIKIHVNFRLLDIFRSLGVGFIPAGTISILYEYLLRREFHHEATSVLSRAITKEFTDVNKLVYSGIKTVFPEFPNEEAMIEGSGANKRIRILQTWIINFTQLEKSIQLALNKGAQVQILILNPESQIVECRGRQLSIAVEEVQSRIKTTIADVQNFNNRSKKGKVDLRFFDELPPMSVYLFNEIIYCGWYWAHAPSLNGPFLKITDKKSIMYQFCTNTFDHLFDDALELHMLSDKWKNPI